VRTVAPLAMPPSPKPLPLVAEPATVLMLYVGAAGGVVWPYSTPANPAIKNELTNDLFTKVSLFDAGQNTVEYGRL
jgi:hypothetical protein